MGFHTELILIAIATAVVLQTTHALPLLPVGEVMQKNLKCPISATIREDYNLIPRKIKMITCDVSKLGPKADDGCVEVTDTVWVWNVQEESHETLTVSVGCVAAPEQFVNAARMPGDQ